MKRCKVTDESIQLIRWSIVNSNPCIGEIEPNETMRLETGEMVRAVLVNRSDVPVEVRGIVTVLAARKYECIPFDRVTLQPGEQITLTTPPFVGPNGGDGKIEQIAFGKSFPSGAPTQPTERIPYTAPTLEQFEFTLQPSFFMAGGDAVRSVVERAPSCHLGCTWNAVTSFLLGVILPHYDDNARLQSASRVIIPKLIELQAIATADDPVAFVKLKRLTCFIDESKGSGNEHKN
jgi:hypothetical protein